ncbi:hypothetical protein Q1695_012181 [Nippostrongylus brasiliensis]|nr:hypothetical protein Q1695_012181 [Nippostrongylus brasiliensis]
MDTRPNTSIALLLLVITFVIALVNAGTPEKDYSFQIMTTPHGVFTSSTLLIGVRRQLNLVDFV